MVAGLTGNPTNNIDEADVIIDDLIDSGATEQRYAKHKKPFEALIDKRQEYKDEWLVFPWEQKEDGIETVEDNVTRLLQYFGEDVNREGLQETPKRFVKFFREFLNPPEWNCTSFEGEGYDEMIVQTNIPFHSLCEHHIAPFFGYRNNSIHTKQKNSRTKQTSKNIRNICKEITKSRTHNNTSGRVLME